LRGTFNRSVRAAERNIIASNGSRIPSAVGEIRPHPARREARQGDDLSDFTLVWIARAAADPATRASGYIDWMEIPLYLNHLMLWDTSS
jgi:hypothetical protein